MASLEHVVRPIVVADFRPSKPQALPVDPNAEPEEFKIEGGSGKAVKETYSANASISYSIKHRERKRIFSNVKVMNPNDHDQHVTVEVPTRIQNKTYSGGLQPSRQVNKYPDQEPSENIDIIDRNNTR